jgi:rhodanese-related sulfurtransferase
VRNVNRNNDIQGKRIMKTLTASLLTLSALLAFAQSTPLQAAEPSKAHILTNKEFDALLANPEKVVVIDVRRPDEVQSVGGFPVYLSIQNSELEKSLAYIPKDRTVITVSNNAGRAGRAADLLAAKGFKVAGAIGAHKYEEDGGKIVRITPPPPRAEGNGNTNAQPAATTSAR